MSDTTIRIDKYLASLGTGSRRGIQDILKYKNITVNGKRIKEHGTRVDPDKDSIKINGSPVQKPKRVYILVNKPKGVISASFDDLHRQTVVSLVKAKERVYPVGTLDQNSTGLVLLTNDGELANTLTHPRYHTPKVYEVLIAGSISENKLTRLKSGVTLEGGMKKITDIHIKKQFIDKTLLEMLVYEETNRDVRRMMDALHIHLIELKQVSLGKLSLGPLAVGEHRMLDENEVALLKP